MALNLVQIIDFPYPDDPHAKRVEWFADTSDALPIKRARAADYQCTHKRLNDSAGEAEHYFEMMRYRRTGGYRAPDEEIK